MPSELALRAQHILREQRDLYGYWRACAGARPVPSRYDIDPVDIPRLLPCLSILEAAKGLEFAALPAGRNARPRDLRHRNYGPRGIRWRAATQKRILVLGLPAGDGGTNSDAGCRPRPRFWPRSPYFDLDAAPAGRAIGRGRACAGLRCGFARQPAPFGGPGGGRFGERVRSPQAPGAGINSEPIRTL